MVVAWREFCKSRLPYTESDHKVASALCCTILRFDGDDDGFSGVLQEEITITETRPHALLAKSAILYDETT